MIHTIEKPFQCQPCPKPGSLKVGLKTHTMVQNEIEPFNCQDCSKSFHQLQSLQRHTNKHTVGKLFSCSQCSQSFSDTNNLENHVLEYAKENSLYKVRIDTLDGASTRNDRDESVMMR